MKKILLVFLALLMRTASSQNVDSLVQVLNKATSDTTKARLYLEISEVAYSKEDFDALYKYAKLALELSEKGLSQSPSASLHTVFLKNKACALNQIGLSLYSKENVIESFDYYKSAVKIYEEINEVYECSISFINLGAIYESVGDLPHAIEYYDNAVKLLDKIANKGRKENDMLAVALNHLGKLFADNHSYTKAEEFYLKALTHYEELSDSMSIVEVQYGLGEVYYGKGDMIKATESYSSAERISVKTANKQIAVFSKNRLSRICQSKGNFSKAEEYYKQILKILKPNDTRLLAMMLRNYAALYLVQNKLKKAEEYAVRALALAQETKNFTSIRDEAEILCKIYNAENNNKSTEICALYTTMNDSVKNEETKKAAGFVKFKEEYEKHEALLKTGETKAGVDKPLTETKSNNMLIFSVVIILLLVICLLLFKRFK